MPAEPRPERDLYADTAARVLLAAVVVGTYSLCITSMAAYRDDYWYLWEWRRDPAAVLDTWTKQGRFANGMIFGAAWRNAEVIADLWQPRLIAVLGIALLAGSIYEVLRRLDYSRHFAVAAGGLSALLPVFGVYAAWATCSGHVFGALAGLGAFWLADGIRIGAVRVIRAVIAAGLLTVGLCIYQPAGMFFVTGVMFLLASPNWQKYSDAARIRLIIHGLVLAAGLAGAAAVFKFSAGSVGGIDVGQRAAFTTDVVTKLGRFIAQPVGQSCAPFWLVNLWPNVALAALAIVMLGFAAPLGIFQRLAGSMSSRLLRTAGLLALVPVTYLPNLLVASDFFPFRTRPAVSVAVLFLLLLALSGLARWLIPTDSKRTIAVRWGLAAALALAVFQSRRHTTELFIAPSQVEWAALKTEVVRQIQSQPHDPRQVIFIMPNPARPIARRCIYDEFGCLGAALGASLPSDQRGVCQGFIGLAVAEVAADRLPGFERAQFTCLRHDEPLAEVVAPAWVIDCRVMNKLGNHGEPQ